MWRRAAVLTASRSSLRVLASASGLSSGTRALAVYEERWAPAPVGPLCVYLHGVHDPGQRRGGPALGAGVRGVVRRARTGDRGPVRAQGGPRARWARSSRVPLARADPRRAPGHEDRARPRRRRTLGGLWRSSYVFVSSNAIGATLLVGSERDGLPEEVVAQADHVAHIPIHTDSLNAAMAATIALYELSRRMAPE